MDTNEIDRLLSLYYSGLSTEADEARLIRYFENADVPPRFEADKEMFAAIAAVGVPDGLEERLVRAIDNRAVDDRRRAAKNRWRHAASWLSAAAACLLLAVGAARMHHSAPSQAPDTMTAEEIYAHTEMALSKFARAIDKGMNGLATAEATTAEATSKAFDSFNKI